MSPFKPPSARSASSTPFDLVVRFAVATGLRPSEICGLRVGRLNLVKGTVEVPRR
jgi:integrase